MAQLSLQLQEATSKLTSLQEENATLREERDKLKDVLEDKRQAIPPETQEWLAAIEAELAQANAQNATLTEQLSEAQTAAKNAGPRHHAWVELKDESSGATYYLNEDTQETVWERPPEMDEDPLQKLRRDLAKLKKKDKKNEDNMKKVTIRENAMKADISKMKVETREAKKEAGNAKRELEREKLANEEASERLYMWCDEMVHRIALRDGQAMETIVTAMEKRQLDRSVEVMQQVPTCTKEQVESDLVRVITEQIAEDKRLQELIESLNAQVASLEEQLAFEKSERERENREWSEHVDMKNAEIEGLNSHIEGLDAHIAELNQYIADSDERHKGEIEFLRLNDRNEVASLMAKLELEKKTKTKEFAEMAEMWPDDVSPPTVLRPYVAALQRKELSAEELNELEIGTEVMAWDIESQDYFAATITNIFQPTKKKVRRGKRGNVRKKSTTSETTTQSRDKDHKTDGTESDQVDNKVVIDNDDKDNQIENEGDKKSDIDEEQHKKENDGEGKSDTDKEHKSNNNKDGSESELKNENDTLKDLELDKNNESSDQQSDTENQKQDTTSATDDQNNDQVNNAEEQSLKFEIRWKDGGNVPPAIVPGNLVYSIATITAPTKEVETQTQILGSDHCFSVSESRSKTALKRTRSSYGRLDGGAEANDNFQLAAVKARADKSKVASIKAETEVCSRELYKLINSANDGQVTLQQIRSNLRENDHVIELCQQKSVLSPLLNLKLFDWAVACCDVDPMLVPSRKFRQVCIKVALAQSRCGPIPGDNVFDIFHIGDGNVGHQFEHLEKNDVVLTVLDPASVVREKNLLKKRIGHVERCEQLEMKHEECISWMLENQSKAVTKSKLINESFQMLQEDINSIHLQVQFYQDNILKLEGRFKPSLDVDENFELKEQDDALQDGKVGTENSDVDQIAKESNDEQVLPSGDAASSTPEVSANQLGEISGNEKNTTNPTVPSKDMANSGAVEDTGNAMASLGNQGSGENTSEQPTNTTVAPTTLQVLHPGQEEFTNHTIHDSPFQEVVANSMEDDSTSKDATTTQAERESPPDSNPTMAQSKTETGEKEEAETVEEVEVKETAQQSELIEKQTSDPKTSTSKEHGDQGEVPDTVEGKNEENNMEKESENAIGKKPSTPKKEAIEEPYVPLQKQLQNATITLSKVREEIVRCKSKLSEFEQQVQESLKLSQPLESNGKTKGKSKGKGKEAEDAPTPVLPSPEQQANLELLAKDVTKVVQEESELLDLVSTLKSKIDKVAELQQQIEKLEETADDLEQLELPLLEQAAKYEDEVAMFWIQETKAEVFQHTFLHANNKLSASLHAVIDTQHRRGRSVLVHMMEHSDLLHRRLVHAEHCLNVSANEIEKKRYTIEVENCMTALATWKTQVYHPVVKQETESRIKLLDEYEYVLNQEAKRIECVSSAQNERFLVREHVAKNFEDLIKFRRRYFDIEMELLTRGRTECDADQCKDDVPNPSTYGQESKPCSTDPKLDVNSSSCSHIDKEIFSAQIAGTKNDKTVDVQILNNSKRRRSAPISEDYSERKPSYNEVKTSQSLHVPSVATQDTSKNSGLVVNKQYGTRSVESSTDSNSHNTIEPASNVNSYEHAQDNTSRKTRTEESHNVERRQDMTKIDSDLAMQNSCAVDDNSNDATMLKLIEEQDYVYSKIQKLEAFSAFTTKSRQFACQREIAWYKDTQMMMETLAGGFLQEQDRNTWVERMEIGDQLVKELRKSLDEQVAYLSSKLKVSNEQRQMLQDELIATESAYKYELNTLVSTSEDSLQLLQSHLHDEQLKRFEAERSVRERAEMCMADNLVLLVRLDKKLQESEHLSEQRAKWIEMLRSEITFLKSEAERLAKQREDERLRSAKERDLLNQQLDAMTSHASRMDNWVNSLKGEIHMLNDEIASAKEKAKDVAARHAQQIRWLRWEVWKRDETGRVLGTNIDFAFIFFVETLSRLAGQSKEFNERLADNCGVEVLMALCESPRLEIQRRAIEAVASCAWNGHRDFRVLSRKAKECWKGWVNGVSSVAALRWTLLRRKQLRRIEENMESKSQKSPSVSPRKGTIDASLESMKAARKKSTATEKNTNNNEESEVVPNAVEEYVRVNLLEHASDIERSEWGTVGLVPRGSTVVSVRNRICVVPDTVVARATGPNYVNQMRVCQSIQGAATLVGLCSSESKSVVQSATGSISMLLLDDTNRKVFGSQHDIVDKLLRLCETGHVKHAPADDTDEVLSQTPETTCDNEDSEKHVDEDSSALSSSEIGGRNSSDNTKNSDIRQETNESKEKVQSRRTSYKLPESNEDPADVSIQVEDIQRNAAHALCNFLYRNSANQTTFGDRGGVEAMLNVCVSSRDVDVIDSVTGALANATSKHPKNSARVAKAGGIRILIDLCNAPNGGLEKLDGSGERIQANIGDTLVNVTSVEGHECIEAIKEYGIEQLVHLCTSQSLPVQRCSSLILGNISQDDHVRVEIGKLGGIDVLFHLADSTDSATASNALWALSNTAWSASNQDQVGHHLPQLLRLCTKSQHTNVRENALATLANSLFYHEGNRKRVGHIAGSVEDLLSLLKPDYGTQKRFESDKVQSGAARALGTCAYNDAVALQIGVLGGCETLVKLVSQTNSTEVKRFASMAISNLGLFDVHKPILVEAGAIEALTSVCGTTDPHAVKAAMKALEILADCARAEDMLAKRKDFGVKGLVQLCQGSAIVNNDLMTNEELASVPGIPVMHRKQAAVQALACEQLAVEAAQGIEAKLEIIKAGGAKVLLEILNEYGSHVKVEFGSAPLGQVSLGRKLQCRAMWVTQNLVRNFKLAQTLFGDTGLIETLARKLAMSPPPSDSNAWYTLVVDPDDPNTKQKQLHNKPKWLDFDEGGDVVVSALETMYLCAVEHERNSRMIIFHCLDDVIQIAEMALPPKRTANNSNLVQVTDQVSRESAKSLAISILQIVAPHSWVACQNCGSHEHGGTVCKQCGHELEFNAEVHVPESKGELGNIDL